VIERRLAFWELTAAAVCACGCTVSRERRYEIARVGQYPPHPQPGGEAGQLRISWALTAPIGHLITERPDQGAWMGGTGSNMPEAGPRADPSLGLCDPRCKTPPIGLCNAVASTPWPTGNRRELRGHSSSVATIAGGVGCLNADFGHATFAGSQTRRP
jgi:hypothetical protein